MNILFVGAFRTTLNDGKSGGQTFACTSLADAIRNAGHNVDLVDSSAGSITDTGFLERAIRALARLSRVVWMLAANRYDYAYLFCSAGLSFIEKAIMVLAARALGARPVLFPRSGALIRQVDHSRLFKSIVSLCIRMCDSVICQSHSWAAFFSRLYPAGNFVVIENWLPGELEADARLRLALRKQISQGDGERGVRATFRVAFYSRLEKDKGIYEYIEALRIAHEREPSVIGVIYGSGNEAEVVKEIVERGLDERKFLRWGGWLTAEAKKTAFDNIDCMLFMSHYEGYPNAVLEMMAAGVPIVSTKLPAIVDLSDGGKTCVVVDLGDVDAAARAIVNLALSPATAGAISLAALERVMDKNTMSGAISTLLGRGVARC